jgi:hypothetical protein
MDIRVSDRGFQIKFERNRGIVERKHNLQAMACNNVLRSHTKGWGLVKRAGEHLILYCEVADTFRIQMRETLQEIPLGDKPSFPG